MNEFNIRHLAGFIIGLVAAAIAGALLLGTVSLDGKGVPNELDELVSQSQQPDFVVPTAFDATCFPVDQVTDDTLGDIKTVTGQDAPDCSFEDDALDGDALWGAFAFAAACVLLFFVFRLYQSSQTVGIVVFAASILGALLLGSWLDDHFKDWLTDNNIIGAIFWRGFGAAAVVAIGGLFAHEAHRRQP